MDLSISPDFEALYCYFLVFLIGFAVAIKRVSDLLSGFRGAWVTKGTWVLLSVYTLLPVGLFWLLDRTGAIHGTSLFAAILVAMAYRQILAGNLQGIAAPGQASKAWQPLVEWTDRVAAGIRDRIQRNNARYEERVLSRMARTPSRLEDLAKLVQSHTANPAEVQSNLNALATSFAALGPAGVARKQAAYLYQNLKVVPSLDFEYSMYQQGITSKFQYYWYVKEWRSKTLALAVAMFVLAATLWLSTELRTPQNVVRYYVWRLQKSNATSYDRHRARQRLGVYVHGLDARPATSAMCSQMASLLRYEALPVDTADALLAVLVEHRAPAFQFQAGLPSLLTDALRTSNPDIRLRIHQALLFLAADRGLTVPNTLGEWRPTGHDPMKDLEERIKLWLQIWRQS